MEILLIIGLILLNGVFSMSEIAIISARRARLASAANQGDKAAGLALRLAESPNRLLSTVQIGITLIGIMTGVFSGANIAQEIAALASHHELLRPYSRSIGFVVVIVAITFLSLVLGELLPKRIGLSNPEKIARLVAGPMHALSRVATPLVWLLGLVTDLILRMLGVKPASGSQVTEEEIKALIAEGATSGAIDAIEEDIVQRVFHLGEKAIGSLMVHRSDVVWLDIREGPGQHQQTIMDHIHSAYPVCDQDIDKVLGIIHVKDVLTLMFKAEPLDLQAILKPVLFVPENMKAYKVLQKFRDARIHYAVVIDEYGSVLGLVTINDLLEDLVSDVASETQADAGIVQRADGSWLLEGQLPFEDFVHYFEIPEKQVEEFYGFRTMAGFLLHLLERIPQEGDNVAWTDFSFEVVDMDGHRIDKILAYRQASG